MADDTVNEITDVRRMRAAWDRGINYLASFYTMLDAKRKEIGDEAMSDWCFNELRISLSILLRISEVLEDSDKARVREELSRAAELDRQKKQAERREAEEKKHAETLERETRKLERAKELLAIAEAARETAKKTARVNTKKSDKPADPNKPPRTRKPRASEEDTKPTLDALATKAHEILDRIDENNQQWINSTIELMTTLRQARDDCNTNNNAFGKWFESSGLEKRVNKNDRQALLKMSENLEVARIELERTTRRSWQLIWQDMKNAALDDDKVVPLRNTPEAG